MDVEMPKGRSFQKGYRGVELQIYEDDLDRLEQVELNKHAPLQTCLVHHRLPFGTMDLISHNENFSLTMRAQMEDSEGTVRQIGAFSEGINNLTVILYQLCICTYAWLCILERS